MVILFLLVSNSSLRTFSGSSVGLGLLTTNRKAFSMTNTSVASDFLQSLDVHCDLSSKITLYGNGLVDYITDTSYFFIGQISDTGIRIDICLLPESCRNLLYRFRRYKSDPISTRFSLGKSTPAIRAM